MTFPSHLLPSSDSADVRTAQDCTESTLEAADRAIIVSALDEASPGWLRDIDAACDPEAVPAEATVEVTVRSEVNSELNFCPNFEGLVLGCIDADFCK